MNESTMIANMLLEKRGYLVFSWNERRGPIPAIGDVLGTQENVYRGESIEGPMRVVSYTDRADAEEQAKIAGKTIARTSYPVSAYLRVVAE